MGIDARLEIRAESKIRMSKLKKGDQVTNICAGDKNPRRLSCFVSYIEKSRKNKYGVIMTEHHAKCQNSTGESWLTDIDVIYPGSLSMEECEKLFSPVWNAIYR